MNTSNEAIVAAALTGESKPKRRRKKKGDDEEGPKKPAAGAYQMFSKDIRPKIKEAHPGFIFIFNFTHQFVKSMSSLRSTKKLESCGAWKELER